MIYIYIYMTSLQKVKCQSNHQSRGRVRGKRLAETSSLKLNQTIPKDGNTLNISLSERKS